MRRKTGEINENRHIADKKQHISCADGGGDGQPFRDECVRMGAGLVYSEMVSAKGLAYGNRHTRVLLASGDYPCGVQLFGSDPETIARQAAAPELEEFDLIDINMGCPARKITGNCEGSALMLRPGLAYAIIRETVAAVKKPVTTALVFVAIVIFGLFFINQIISGPAARDRDKHDHGHDLLCRRQRCGYRNERLQPLENVLNSVSDLNTSRHSHVKTFQSSH